ncbi:MAG: hypothetical protein WD604_07065 [Balneolaceae bacterium]
MLEKLKTWVKKATEITPFDPSLFNDPLAETIEWIPLKKGGTNFHTHRMAAVDSHRMEFLPTIGVKIFAGIFIAAGLGFPLMFHYARFGEDFTSGWGVLYIWLFGLAFVGVGSVFYYKMAKPRIFDKYDGMYWRGHKKPDLLYKLEDKTAKNATRLSDIHAIQLLREYVRSDKSSYYSYELNLVLKNGHRINVIDHGNKKKFLEDARQLSLFLDKPVWNAFEVI